MGTARKSKTQIRLKADHLFRPTAAIRSDFSYLFAGRETSLHDVFRSIELDGQVPVIYGERGIGKSSLAWRVFDILNNIGTEKEDIDMTGNFDLEQEYRCFWIECEERFENIETTLLGLLAPRGSKQAVTAFDSFPALAKTELGIKIKTTFEANIHFFKGIAEVSPEEKSGAIQDAIREVLAGRLSDPIELFGQTMSEISRQIPNAQIVVFLDELDRLKDKKRIGDLIKHVTGIRFVFVGVSETGRNLIGGHESVIRKVDEIYVPPFTEQESRQIFENATKYISSLGIGNTIEFSDDFINIAHEDSGGYPYLSQRFGYHAVNEGRYNREVLDKNIIVDIEDYRKSVRAMFSKKRPGSAIDIGAQIKEAVGDAKRREAIVRALTKSTSEWMTQTDLLGDLNKGDRKDFDDNIEKLVSHGVLKRSDDSHTKLKFASPVHRLACILWLKRKYI